MKRRQPSKTNQDFRLVLVEKSLEGLVESLGLALVGLDVTKTLLGKGRGVWVEAEKDLLVAERVLLLDDATLGDGGALGGAKDGLHFGRVDELDNVGLGDRVGGEEVVLLEGRGLGGGAVDLVKSLERRRGPDDEATEMATGSELEEVQGVDGRGLDTGDVAESADKLLSILVGVVDDEGTATLLVATVSQLTLTGTELLRVLDLLDVLASTDGLEERKSGRRLGNGGVGESSRRDDERNLGDGGDLVATGKEKGGAGRCSDGGSSGETPEHCVSLSSPLASLAHLWMLLTSGQG